MKSRLTAIQLEYVLDHIGHHAELPEWLRKMIVYGANQDPVQPSIYFPASEEELNMDKVIRIDDIPVLYPVAELSDTFYAFKAKSLCFNHDLLKSVFHLLSGYEEVKNGTTDQYGRFPWTSSIQFRLGITQKPVVNYYFEVILQAMEIFCGLNGHDFHRKQPTSPLLSLSHDVDRIRKYSLRNMVYTGLQLPGIIPSDYTLKKRWKIFRDYARGTLLFRKDPYWNMDELMALERSLNISSTWFFLEKTGKDNSRYHFRDGKITTLISQLEEQGHEVGIHGTLESSENPLAMSGALQRLNEVSTAPVQGNRQHFLKYSNPLTTKILDQSSLLYDASMGFAEHIGFRNSYAHPFRLYDFTNDRPAKLWELPLMVMDVTLLNYMNIPNEQILDTVRPVMEETLRFNGVFSLLVHNCNLDEEEYPGINEVYLSMLHMLLEAGFESQTGRQIIGALKTSGS